MTVFGDVLDLILKPLDYGRRPVPIANADSSNCDRSLPRPWNDVLAVNKQQWTAKHDAGTNLFPPSEMLKIVVKYINTYLIHEILIQRS